jgi:hypothetical protein
MSSATKAPGAEGPGAYGIPGLPDRLSQSDQLRIFSAYYADRLPAEAAAELCEFADEWDEQIASAPAPSDPAGAGGDLGKLERLSKAATQGEFQTLSAGRDKLLALIPRADCNGIVINRWISLKAADLVYLSALARAHRSGQLVASTPGQKGAGEEKTGAPASPSGSHPSDRTPSGSAGYAVSILRAALVQAAEEQVRYWRERQSHETCPEKCRDEDGHYSPMGDDAAIRFGYCNGRLSESDWWLKTLQTTPLPTLPSVRDRSSEAAETSGSAEGKSPAPQGATPAQTPPSPPSATPEGDPPMTVEEDQIESLIAIWSMRPAPGCEAGQAWEAGARQGWKWAFAALRTLHAAGEVRHG